MQTFDPTSPESADIVAGLRRFIDSEIRPRESRHLAELQETGTLSAQVQVEERRAIRRRSAAAGFYGMGMPAELGGGGASLAVMADAYTAQASTGLLLADRGAVLPSVEGPLRVMAAMSPDQTERYLKPMIRGELEGCFAITEPGAGSDLSTLTTRAVPDGDGWRLTGAKQFITYAKYADILQVVARTDSRGATRPELTAFIVERDAPGLTIGRMQNTIGEDRPFDVVLDDVFVAGDAVLGEVGGALAYAIGGVNQARLNIAALAVGKAIHLLDRMVDYAKERIAFGRAIGAFQFVQGHIVESHIEIGAAYGMLREAALAAEEDTTESRLLTAAAKVQATEMVNRVADRAIQVHGGSGVTTTARIEWIYRDVRAMRIYEGTNDLLRSNIARWMGLPVE